MSHPIFRKSIKGPGGMTTVGEPHDTPTQSYVVHLRVYMGDDDHRTDTFSKVHVTAASPDDAKIAAKKIARREHPGYVGADVTDVKPE